MDLVRFAGVPALTLVLVASGGFAVTAQEAEETSFSATILAGTCAELDRDQDAVVQLADLTYGLGEPGTGTTVETKEMVGAGETALVATGVTRLEMTADEIVSAPHVVAVFEAGGMGAANAVACGAIGGIAPQENLFFGLQEENGSGFAGVGWLNETGESTLLTVMLTSLDATVGAPDAVVATPAAATPVAAAEATPEAMTGMATPAAMPGMATPDATTDTATPEAMAATPAAGATGTTVTDSEAVGATPSAATPAAGTGTEADATPAAATAAADAAAAQDGAAETVTIESVDIDFIPDEVTIPADTDVTIELPNNGVTIHTFLIDERNNEDVPNLDIFVEIAPGAAEQVTVNAPAGEYYFWCDVPGHEPAGMFGTLIVE
jgi:uncharacterized cupredoxin-like copper-binding protein